MCGLVWKSYGSRILLVLGLQTRSFQDSFAAVDAQPVTWRKKVDWKMGSHGSVLQTMSQPFVFFFPPQKHPKFSPKVSPQSCIMKKTNRRVHNFHPDVWDKNPEVGSNRHVTFCMVDLGLEFLARTFFFLFLFDKLINVWKKNTWMQGPEPRCSQFLTLIEMLLKSLEHHRLGFAKCFLIREGLAILSLEYELNDWSTYPSRKKAWLRAYESLWTVGFPQ